MKANHVMREAVNATQLDPIYMVYDVEEGDPPRNWLHEGVSHACDQVWQRKFSDVLRPFRTTCGIFVTSRLAKGDDQLFNLVNVETTCLWCMGERIRK